MYGKYWKENGRIMHCNNTKESKIKGELQLISMNKTINFIGEKFDGLEKDGREKDEIIKSLSKKNM